MKIIVDTREKKPWNFSAYGIEEIRQKLDEGDYTTKEILDREEAEDRKILRIERKRSVSEIAGNLGKKVSKERFYRELDRLEPYEHKYLIMEFTQQDVLKYPYGCGIPKKARKYIKMRGKFLLSLLGEIESLYGIQLIYCNDEFEAQEKALSIIQEITDAD